MRSPFIYLDRLDSKILPENLPNRAYPIKPNRVTERIYLSKKAVENKKKSVKQNIESIKKTTPQNFVPTYFDDISVWNQLSSDISRFSRSL